MKETARLHPPVEVVGRTCIKSHWLAEGVYVPRGARVDVDLATAQRLETAWDNPDDFDPERWRFEDMPDMSISTLPHMTQKTPTYEFLLYSAGPRNCVGRVFADFEIKTILAIILLKLNFKLSPDCKPKLGVEVLTKKIEGGLPMIFSRRDIHKK